eukprot:7332732-Pyramimonas_sp.AAC.1
MRNCCLLGLSGFGRAWASVASHACMAKRPTNVEPGSPDLVWPLRGPNLAVRIGPPEGPWDFFVVDGQEIARVTGRRRSRRTRRRRSRRSRRGRGEEEEPKEKVQDFE